MNENRLYVDLDKMHIAEKRIELLEKIVMDSKFTYPNPSDYNSDEEYDVSSINDEKRIELKDKVWSFLFAYSNHVRQFDRAYQRATELLAKYRNEVNFSISPLVKGKPTVLFVGNSYYYYEGYPHMVKGFLPDINVDTAISSRMGLAEHMALLEAAKKGDKEEFRKILYEFIYRDVGDEGKQYITQYMSEHDITGSDDYTTMLDVAFEQYQRSAKTAHDEVVIEAMGMEEEELKALIKMEYAKNPDVKIIIDKFNDASKEDYEALIKRIATDVDKEGKKAGGDYNVDIKVVNAALLEEKVRNKFDVWSNQAETDGLVHPNKIYSYTGSRVVSGIMLSDLESYSLQYNDQYNGDTSDAIYPDLTYGVYQNTRNNYKETHPESGSTDSGTDDKTDDLTVVTEYKSLVEEIVLSPDYDLQYIHVEK